MSWATQMIKDLQEGKTVQCRPRGNSMTGRIDSGQLCTIEPVSREIHKGDIVLCRVRGTQYLHLVTGVRPNQYQISNNHNHVNGWTQARNVFGILTKVEP